MTVVLVMAAGFGLVAKPFVIAFMPGVTDPFYFTMQKGAEAMAAQLGPDKVKLVVGQYPATWGPAAQVPLLNALMARGDIDLLFIAPTSTEALIPVLKAYYDKGIPIITVDTYLGNGDYTKPSNYSFPLSYIGTDNKLGGEVVAAEMAVLLGGKGKVFLENTNPDTSSVMDRERGFRQGLQGFPQMDLVGVEYCLDNQETAQAQVSNALQLYPDLAGIFGVNVYSAQGAHAAVAAAGLSGVVKVGTWDATATLIEALKKGEIDFVLAQKPAQMGSLCVDWGYRYLASGKTLSVPKKIVPGFFLFTKENVNNPEAQKYIYSK